MTKRFRMYRDSPDPEERRWGQTYPRFPGVAECVRLIHSGKARGVWIDIIAWELTDHAKECFDELVRAFREEKPLASTAAFVILEAIEVAKLPEAIPFWSEVLAEGHPEFGRYARRALKAINSRESRTVLWKAEHDSKMNGD